MNVTIHGRLRDTLSFIGHLRERKRRFRKAQATPLATGAMNLLAETLHPAMIDMRIESRRQETDTIITFRLIPARAGMRLPPFRAGQYLSARFTINGIRTARPFSISSSPDEALQGNYYDITAKLKPDGFCTAFMFERWAPGSTVQCSGPSGYFYHEPLRDGLRIVCLAGGTGVTPFKSIITDSLAYTDAVFTLIYGITAPEDAIFIDDFTCLESKYPGRIKLVKVCAQPDGSWDGERGFITGALIQKYVADHSQASYFICGPDMMKKYLDGQMQGWGLRNRQTRKENYAESVNPATLPDYPGTRGKQQFSIQVHAGSTHKTISADPGETVLVALERAGLNPPSLCRSGDCGWCRSRLLQGEFFSPSSDAITGAQVRAADEAFSYFHPCQSWPLSDIIMEILPNTAQDKEDQR
jgi:ferredoxin-NADP reductase